LKYQFEISINTALDKDSGCRFLDAAVKEHKWGSGLKNLPEGTYNLSILYENKGNTYEQWIEKKGYTTTKAITLKNVWMGKTKSDTVSFKLLKQK
jgi:hypothetical protein